MKQFIASLLIVFLLGSAAVLAQPQTEIRPSSTFPALDRPDETIERGDEAYNRFDNAAARELYMQAYERDSLRYALLYRLASTASDRGRDLLAEDAPDGAESFFREATGYARQLRTHFPERSGSWFQMAATVGNLALFAGGRQKVGLGRDVETYARKALELDSTNANAHLALGIFYREVGELNWIQRMAANALFGGVPDGGIDRALPALHRARRLNPDLNMIHYELAVTYLAADRPEDAVPHLRQAARLPVLNTDEVRNREWAREQLRGIEEGGD